MDGLDVGDIEQKEQTGDQAHFAVGAQPVVGQGQDQAGQHVARDGQQVEERRVVAPGRVGGPHHQFVNQAS